MRALFRLALYAVLASPVAAAIGAGCGSSTDTGASGSTHSSGSSSQSTASAATSSGGGGSGGTGMGGATGGTGVGGGTGPGGNCTPGGSQCTDCIDNDNDGWIDSWDVECVGPLDNDEGSFATGLPGDNSDPCKQDCFFDGNSGSGNDGCLWDLSCDPLNPGAPDCPYDANQNNCPPPPTTACLDFCGDFTPNGCDCFGCCLIALPNQMSVTISLATPGCDQEHAT